MKSNRRLKIKEKSLDSSTKRVQEAYVPPEIMIKHYIKREDSQASHKSIDTQAYLYESRETLVKPTVKVA